MTPQVASIYLDKLTEIDLTGGDKKVLLLQDVPQT